MGEWRFLSQGKEKMGSPNLKPRKKVASGNVRKRKRSTGGSEDGALKVRTPRDAALKHLAVLDLIVPEEIPSDDDNVPLDFTELSNRDLGALHSRYAVRHAYAIFQAAKAEGKIASLKRNLKFNEATFRIKHKDLVLNVVQAMMEDDEGITKQRDRVSRAETEHKLIDAVADGYEGIRNAASREISRRLGERAAVD